MSDPTDRLSARVLCAALDASPFGIYVFELEDKSRAESLRLVYANTTSAELIGVEPSDVVGKLIGEVSGRIGGDRYATAFHASARDQTPADLGSLSFGGDEILVGITVHPLGDATVAVQFENLSTSSRRVTESQRLATIINFAEEAIISTDLDGTILSWNRAAEALYRYRSAEAVGRSITMLLPPDRPDEMKEILVRLRAGERLSNFETKRISLDGAEIEVSLTISPIPDASGETIGIATFARDITEQKAAETRLRIFASVVESSQDAILTRTPEGVITSMNPAAEALYGITAAEAVGQQTELVAHAMYGRDAPPAEVLSIRSAMAHHETVAPMEMTLPQQDGSEGIFTLTFCPIRDTVGTIIAYSLVLRNVTEFRELERRASQVQRLESIGRLAGGIAHDFNNLLTIIQTGTELLLAKLDDEGLKARASQISQAAELGATLTAQLLAFSRRQVLRPEVLELNGVIDATCEMLDRLIGKDVLIRTDLSPTLPSISIDRAQLQQVILNLCVNACDAMPDGGTITIRTADVLLDRPDVDKPDLRPGRYVVLEITDTGAGMDAETKQRIFDPFYSTKSSGTGLGLATVYGIVEQSGAETFVISKVGLGTTFEIYFPALERAPSPTSSRSATGETVDRERTILVVDDNEMIRRLTCEVLESAGYIVLSAANGFDARQVAQDHVGKIDVLVTDLAMPHMSGKELARAVRTTHPGIDVLFMSGYSVDVEIQDLVASGQAEFIQKPFTTNELLGKIRAIR